MGLTCPYCRTYETTGYYAERDLSHHKMRCSEKRYLGGELSLTFGDAKTLLEGDDHE